MKKITLITAMIFAFTMFANVATAQNESIYDLDVSMDNGISFYSTYDMNNASIIHLSSYDGTSNNQLSEWIFRRNEYDLNSISFTHPTTGFPANCESTEDDVYKVIIYDDYDYSHLINWLIPDEDKLTRIELYIEGEGFISPFISSGISTQSLGRSNVLTFFYPTTTSLNTTINSNKKATGYYNILGTKLLQEPTSGIYIIMYDNGQTEKVMK